MRTLSPLYYLALLLAAVLIGCATHHRNLPDSTPLVGNALSRTELRRSIAAENVAEVVKTTDGTPKMHAQQAAKQLDNQKHDIEDAGDALKKVQAESAHKDQIIEKQDQQIKDMDSRWYVRWGKRVQAWFWTGVIIWAALGVLAMFTGLQPLSWLEWLGKEIVRVLPAMNIFSWIRDWIKRRREQG